MTTLSKMRGERAYWERRYEDNWDTPFHGMSQESEGFMQREQDGIRGQLPQLLEPHHRVLDAGCGYGRLTAMVCPLVREYVGVDFSEQAIEEARKGAPDNAEFVVGDLAEIDLNPFDVILMVGVASSVSYRPELVEHLRSLLAPGGCIAMFDYGDDRIIRA